MKRYDASATAAKITVSPSGEAGSFAAQVAIPLCQAALGGLALGAVVGAVCWAFWDAEAWPLVGGLAAVVGGAGLFLALVWDARLLLRTTTTEPATFWPEPEQPQPRARIVPVFAAGRNVATLRANERQERFRRFVLACGRSTARRGLLREFSEREAAEFRAVLLRLGYARQRGDDPRLGWELTVPASEVLAEMSL